MIHLNNINYASDLSILINQNKLLNLLWKSPTLYEIIIKILPLSIYINHLAQEHIPSKHSLFETELSFDS